MCVLNYVAKPIKKTVASESNQKPRNFTRKLYERVIKTCRWWYSKFTPSGYKWKPKFGKENVNPNLIEIVLFIIDSGCSKHMTGNLKLLINFVEKFLGTVKFGNDQVAPILIYGDLFKSPIKRQANVPQADRTVTTSNELDFLFSLMFDELLNGSSKVMSKTSVVYAADATNQRQQLTTPLNNHTIAAPTCQVPTLEPTVISSENINQAETYAENDQVIDDEFINIFCTPVQDQGETLSCHVDSSNMHTFYQRYPSEHRWTKDHPLEQVIGNPSQSVRTRRQLESDAEMCMFTLTMSRIEPKNIKEAMADSA
nr:Gag-Pol polyprotein [Tanacetum cinerariifolium]